MFGSTAERTRGGGAPTATQAANLQSGAGPFG